MLERVCHFLFEVFSPPTILKGYSHGGSMLPFASVIREVFSLALWIYKTWGIGVKSTANSF